ncbi:MAG: DMT family transporter [Parvibaculaceae bacterium]
MINRTMGPVEWAMLILLSVVWGGSFFFYAVAVKELPTFTIVFLRVALGSAGLWLTAWAMGLLPPRRSGLWRDFLIMGLINNAIPFSLIVWGQHEVASGLAAILNATTPFFTVLVANMLTADEKLSWNRLLGAVIGLSGVAAMMGADILAARQGSLLAQLAIVLAAVFYAFASVFGRRFATVPPLITAAGQTTASSLILLPAMLVIDMPWRLSSPSLDVWLAIIGLAILCTSLAYILYFTILKRAGATNIVLVTFLVPVSAILLGIAFLGETLDLHHIVGMATIAMGLALIDGRLLALVKPRRA